MNKLLPFIFLLVIIISCDDDVETCLNGIRYERNEDLDFLPYNVGDLVFFADSLGNRDTLSVDSYSKDVQYAGDGLCIDSENMVVGVALNYDGAETCNMVFISFPPSPVFNIISTGECMLEGNSQQNINSINDYEFEGVTYESVYEIDLTAANAAFEKIVIAKDAGFLFFTINGVTRKVI